jgi:FkbM family methyltransferase
MSDGAAASDRAEAVRDLDCIVASNPLGRYCIPISSGFRHCAKVVAGGHVFEPRTIEFLARHIGTGDLVHAGAFFGDFLPALSRAASPGALVWAFEPSAENYVCAAITMQLNELANVKLIKAGLGAEASSGHIQTEDAQGRPLGEESFIAKGAPIAGRAAEKIKIVRLDDIIPADRQVRVLQLDVEGYEELALTGALELIQRCTPILVLEKVPEPAWIAQHLTPLGYRVRAGVHGNTVLAVRPVASPLQRVRLAARNWLKQVIPNRIRRRVRAIEAEQLGRHSTAEDWSSRPPFVVDGHAYRLRTSQGIS